MDSINLGQSGKSKHTNVFGEGGLGHVASVKVINYIIDDLKLYKLEKKHCKQLYRVKKKCRL